MNQYMTQISQYIDGHRDEMLHFWKDLVNFQAGSRETDRIEALLRRTMGRLEEEGLDCRLIPSGGVPVLLATDGARRSGRPIFLCGHLDTVFPDGTYPEVNMVNRSVDMKKPNTPVLNRVNHRKYSFVRGLSFQDAKVPVNTIMELSSSMTTEIPSTPTE